MNRFVQYLDCGGKLHEMQAGFLAGRSCMHNVYVLYEVVQGRLKAEKVTCAYFLYVKSL